MAGVLFLWSCQKKEKTLFHLLDPDDTGVHFSNTIIDSRDFNILNTFYIYNGGGVSVGDFDNNGLTDLFFTGNMVENKLYLNKGNMKFKDATAVAGVGAMGKWSYGSSVVDINGDGWLDIYVCASLSADPEERANMLFINQGLNEDGVPVFRDEAKSYGLDVTSHSTQAAFFDYDLDGDLDVIILTNLRVEGIPMVYRPKIKDGSSELTDQLFRNNGDGTFTEVSIDAGITIEGFGLGLATVDVDKDGKVDIYIGNDYLTNDVLYLNQGGNFVERIDSSIKHQSRFSMGNDAADINNDGYLDIMTLDMLPETNLRKKTVLIPNGYIVYINDFRYGYTHQYVRNMLQVNNGPTADGKGMKFSEVGQLAGVHQTEWSWSPLFADFDNDGYKDLAITNGYPKDITDLDFSDFRMETTGYINVEDLLKQIPVVKIPNYVFRNNGPATGGSGVTFTDYSEKWGFTQPSFSNGAAFADLDNDGDLDYIVNNIDDPAFIYENTINENPETAHHYLRIKLKGPKENPSAFGAKITLWYDGGKMQFHEQNIYRGYVSTVEDVAHFGLGATGKADSITVEWPGDRWTTLKAVDADQVITLDYADAAEIAPVGQEFEPAALLSNITQERGLAFQHQETDFIDFNIQRNLPHKFSQFGPSLSVGDINGDGLDDLFVGGSKGYAGSIFLQDAKGVFRQSTGGPAPQKAEEDMGALLFDADGDGDNDLYVVSGSVELEKDSESYNDCLYLNDGKGNFTLDTEALPDLRSSGSCVRGADFDADGDIDLFVGGRVVVGAYPLPPQSYLLRNEGGRFSDITKEVSPDLSEIGMVTDALWSDYDNDNDPDLILVGEFMPVTVFNNQNGKLSPATVSGLQHSGIWNSIVSGDFDKDGDPDYVIGNLGTNNFYCATPETPVSIIAKDFDNNGDLDAIMSCYFRAEDGSMQAFPIKSWKEMGLMSPMFRKRFTSYNEYGRTTLDQLLSPEEREGALELEADFLETAYAENLGNGQFRLTPLPLPAQVAPVNGLIAADINNDTELDILMVGNDYGNEVNMGQYDAMIGLVLVGDGAGNFKPLKVQESGFLVEGDAKALSRLVTAGGRELFIASKNRGRLEGFARNHSDKRFISARANEFKALLHYGGGKTQYVDIPYGSGFLSQSSRKIPVSRSVEKVELIDFSGKSREVSLNEVQ